MSFFENEYALVISQDVRWGEMDAYRHVNNTVYFRYFENIRLAYFEKTRMDRYKEEQNIGPILARTECDFRTPLQYPDHVRIATNCKILSEKKFQMDYIVYSEKQACVAAEGSGLIVFYDYAARRSCKIPDDVVEAMNQLNRCIHEQVQ